MRKTVNVNRPAEVCKDCLLKRENFQNVDQKVDAFKSQNWLNQSLFWPNREWARLSWMKQPDWFLFPEQE